MINIFKRLINNLLLFALVVLPAGCKEKFISPVPPVVTGYLVVEGVINNEGSETNIHLSRTTSLSDTSKLLEQGASVLLEDSLNNVLMLQEYSAGIFTINNLHLDTSHSYRLTIKTTNNENYQSDFVKVRYNPPIDSINWVRDQNGVQLFINTHDPNNNTRYYQWEFNETWEFHSPFTAGLKWVITGPDYDQYYDVANRDANDPQISKCWQFNASSSISLGSSAKLVQDIIHLPLLQIPDASWKLSVLYSVLVKQYSWSKEGFDFLGRMKKNTESVGSVFDAQPSELNGNIHCISNPGLPVIGFFNICTIRENRIFIKSSEVPNWNYRSGCIHFAIPNISDSIKAKAIGKLPIDPILIAPGGHIVSFYVSTAECVDCTLSGTNVKPHYWP